MFEVILSPEAQRALVTHPVRRRLEPSSEAVGRWRAVVWLLLGLWIVAHGCHADRDTELRARPGVTASCP